MRTYSRQRLQRDYKDEPPAKRRRASSTPEATDACPPVFNAPLEQKLPSAPSSSPQEKRILCSDPVFPRSTPPSSPPPRSPTRKAVSRRPTFSFVNRSGPQSTRKRPLAESSGNARKAVPPKKQQLTQLQIDLGGDLAKKCKTCGMEYIPSNEEDRALHKKFHSMNLLGVDVGKTFKETARTRTIWQNEEGDYVVAITRRDSLAMRNRALKVLGVVNLELGACEIKEDELWSQVAIQGASNLGKPERQNGRDTVTETRPVRTECDRYKMCLYVRNDKCVGACLVERISEAYDVLETKKKDRGNTKAGPTASSSSINASTSTSRAMMGISRIWTSSSHRRAGIARRLLDSAAKDFIYGISVPQAVIAFSQPTDSGAQLARRWFGKESGWLVYAE